MIEPLRTGPRASGFTLVEMIVTLVVGAVLFALGGTVISNAFRTYFIGREITGDDWQGRLALERMTRELRTVRSTADLNIGTQNQITFTDYSGTSIVYRRNAGTSRLERSQDGGASWQPLADNINALTITYLRSDGVTTEPYTGLSANVYYITVQVTVSSTNVTATYRSTVKPVQF